MEKIPVTMNSQQLAQTKRKVERINKEILSQSNKLFKGKKKSFENSLGKDAFLKLLVTELRHQDPTKPMEDREFISQMAQFSSLEQMTNINNEMKSLIRSSRSSEAYSLLGKRIDAFNETKKLRVSGIVTSVKKIGKQFNLMVGNQEVSISDVHAIHHVGNKK
ncbi:flagellar hook assembly protein FlgD [Spirochaetota bacterium]